VATIMRARTTYNLGGTQGHQALLQTYWRPGTSPGSTADATDILARVRACLLAAQSAIGNGVTFTAQSEVDALDDATGAITGSFAGALPATVAGTMAGDPMPASVAYLMKATTNLIVGPRLLKGRLFVGGPTETANSGNGGPITGQLTTMNGAFNGLLTGGATASFPVVWHRPDPLAAVPVGTSGPITGFQGESRFWGVQRGRRL
jgi:hypothetical protein